MMASFPKSTPSASPDASEKRLWPAWQHYAGYYRGFRLSLLAFGMISAGQALTPLPMAWLIRYGFDEALPRHDLQLLIVAGGAILLLTLFSSAGTLWSRKLALNMTKMASRRLREALLLKCYALSRAEYGSADRGKLQATIVQDSERVDAMSQALAVQVIPALIASVVLVALLVYLNAVLCLLIVVVLPVLVLASEVLRKQISRRSNDFRHAFRSFSKGTFFVLQMLDLTHLQAAEQFEIERQKEHLEDMRHASAQLGWLNVVYGETLNIAIAVTSVLILVAGGQAVASRAMTLGSLLSFYVVVGLLANTLRPAWNSIPQIIGGNESLKVLYPLLLPQAAPVYTGRNILEFSGKMTLEAVSFGYADQPILQDISLTVEPHTTVAIIGPNGIGKSTLTYLMLGLYRPQRGRLYAGDVAFDTLDLVNLRRHIGSVMQNPLIFPGTIWENITYGVPEATREEVECASRLATAHEFVREFPQGYATLVGEHGMLLSGGQRQRVALARALLRRPPLLILDEPTNHLDRNTIDQFMKNLRALEPAPAVVMISHDAHLAEQAQFVYVLREGRLEPFAPEAAINLERVAHDK